MFADAQRGAATQRKSVVTLRKVQEFCCYETNGGAGASRKHQLDQEYDEAEFSDEFGRCVCRVLGVKKSEPVGDRLVKFIGLFLKHASEKGESFHLSCVCSVDGMDG